MTIHNWFYRFVRKHSSPIHENKSLLWKKRLSIAYGVIAWNAFGIIVFMIFSGKADWAHYHGVKTDEEKNIPPGRAWAKTLGINNAKVIRISNFKKVDEYEIVDGEERRLNERADQNNIE